jgi:hypothetical protein
MVTHFPYLITLEHDFATKRFGQDGLKILKCMGDRTSSLAKIALTNPHVQDDKKMLAELRKLANPPPIINKPKRRPRQLKNPDV